MNTTTKPDDSVSVMDLAHALGTTEITIRKKIAKGFIDSYTIGPARRIPRAKFDRLLAEKRAKESRRG